MNTTEPPPAPSARRNGISNEMVGILAMGVAMIGVSTASWATLRAEIGELRADVREDIGHLRTGIDGLADRTRAVETGLAVVATRLDGVEERLGVVETRLDGVETRLGVVETNLALVDGRLAAVETHTGAVTVAEAERRPARR